MSYTKFKEKDLKFLGKFFFKLYRICHVLHVKTGGGEDSEFVECNNFTLINLLLRLVGPLHEKTLVTILLLFQVNIYGLLALLL